MTCQDFRSRWDELLDADPSAAGAFGAPGVTHPLDEAEALLLAHAADCPACRPIAFQYQTLRRAVREWRRPPEPPPGLVDRILATPIDPTIAIRRPALRIGLISGLAAAVLLAILMRTALNWSIVGQPDRAGPAPTIFVGTIPGTLNQRDALDRALAQATSATWDLARTASEPAARIGRDVLDATTGSGDRPGIASVEAPATASAGPGEGLTGLSVAMPSLDPLGPDAVVASDVLQQVGDRLSAGVRPLSSTARHAFGFLLGPSSARAGANPGGSTSNGARSG